MIEAQKRILFIAFIFVLVLLANLGWAVQQANAQVNPTPGPPVQPVDNETCLACHATPGQTITLASGEELSISVDPEVYHDSIHGELGYACVQCHTNIVDYPHPPLGAATIRDFVVDLYPTCSGCHFEKYQESIDSVHQRELAAGNKQAAVCSDCHGAHNVSDPDEPRTKIPQTCERCHSQIYDLYAESVHGSALIGEGNPDVPTCTDCHGVHRIQGPTDSPFRLHSPEICARCHADEELMARYGVNTDVFDTYVSDFHGTTVAIFEQTAPDQETNKPVCIDCHGVHNILEVNDPNSQVIKDNILSTCQRCHPSATTNFSGAWLSHYRPSPTRHPIVFFVDTFYKIFIPTVLGGMLLFVLADSSRRILSRREKRHE